MKVAQNDETNPDTQPVRPPCIPSIVNMQLSPSGSSVRKRETPGIFSRMFPPFTGITSYRVRTRLALPVVLLCTCLLCIYCFSPLFSLVDPVTMLMPQFDYGVDDPSLLPEQPGKPPLWSPDIAYSSLYCLHYRSVACYCFPLILSWCIACHCCYSCYPYLLSYCLV